MTIDFSALPLWRKAIGVVGLVTFVFLSFASLVREMNIWAAAAITPKPAVGQIYPLHWMHRSVRWVTAADRGSFIFWYSDMSPLIGVFFLLGFFSLFPLRKCYEKRERHRFQ